MEDMDIQFGENQGGPFILLAHDINGNLEHHELYLNESLVNYMAHRRARRGGEQVANEPPSNGRLAYNLATRAILWLKAFFDKVRPFPIACTSSKLIALSVIVAFTPFLLVMAVFLSRLFLFFKVWISVDDFFVALSIDIPPVETTIITAVLLLVLRIGGWVSATFTRYLAVWLFGVVWSTTYLVAH